MSRGRATRWGAGLLAAAGVFACGPNGARSPEAFDRETRATMAEIAAELGVLLPLATSDARFAAPENRASIEQALRALAASAEELDRHGDRGDAAFEALARGLARDAADGWQRFAEGRPEEARFLVQELVDDCVGCHSRLTGPSSELLGPSLVAAVPRESLTPPEWARLLVATRQFDAALDAYEAILSAPSGAVRPVDLEPLVVDYLIVALRVQGDAERAARGLERVAQRSDLPVYLARLVASWRGDLARLPSPPAGGAGVASGAEALARARELLGDPARGPFAGRGGLVDDLVASGLLHAFVHAHPGASAEAAEAYFLLGVTELRVHRSAWVSPADAYLETAIRMEPGADWAPTAYELLEASTYREYQGSSGRDLPAGVRERLEELRDLMDG